MQQITERVAVFFANGLEEVEGLAVVDVLFRAGIPVDMVSISGDVRVESSHKVKLVCDRDIYDKDFEFGDYSVLVLPGGIPGTPNLRACEPLCAALRAHFESGKRVAAICAAPSILAELGILKGKHATANPNFQHVLAENGAELEPDSAVVVDGNITTSQGMGTAVRFGLSLVKQIAGADVAAKVQSAIVDIA